MKLVPIIFCMLFIVTTIWANIDSILIREAGLSNQQELQELVPAIAESILMERDEYPLTVLYENWDNDGWVYDMKDSHSYDENGYPSEILMQEWEDGSWLNFMKMCTDCDTQGLIQESSIEIWDTVENMWLDMMLMTYTYDSNGNWIEILSQVWLFDEYMFSSRITREYNDQNNPTFESNEVWDYAGNWVDNDQSTFSYDGEFLTEVLKETWEDDNSWSNSKLTSYVQESGIYPAEKLIQTWDGGGYWVNTRHNDYTYNNDWHEIEDQEQVWETEMWRNYQSHYYTYDDDNLLERLTKEWESERSWVNHSRYTVEYGNLEIENYEMPQQVDFELTNYPNPFNPNTEIRFTSKDAEGAKIEIYNIKGERVMSIPVTLSDSSSMKSIEGSDFEYSVTWNGTDQNRKPVPSGVYFYKLKIGKEEHTQKMLLIK